MRTSRRIHEILGPEVEKESDKITYKARKIIADTYMALKSIKKHCLRCRKKYNHRHANATADPMKKCDLCDCPWFFGWGNWSRMYNRPIPMRVKKEPKPPADS